MLGTGRTLAGWRRAVLCLLLCGVASSESSESSMLLDHFHTKYARRVDHNHKVPDFYVKFKVGGLDGGRTGYFSIRCSALMSKLGKTSCLSWSVWGRAQLVFLIFLRASRTQTTQAPRGSTSWYTGASTTKRASFASSQDSSHSSAFPETQQSRRSKSAAVCLPCVS